MKPVKLKKLEKLKHVNLGDWLLWTRPAIWWGVGGSLLALSLAIIYPPFEHFDFKLIIACFFFAGLALALIPIWRLATLMRLETGPRYKDLPRLSRAIFVAGCLFLPMLVWQFAYPAKIMLTNLDATGSTEDSRKLVELFEAYVSVRRLKTGINLPVLFETRKLKIADKDKTEQLKKKFVAQEIKKIEKIQSKISSAMPILTRFLLQIKHWGDTDAFSKENQRLGAELDRRLQELKNLPSSVKNRRLSPVSNFIYDYGPGSCDPGICSIAVKLTSLMDMRRSALGMLGPAMGKLALQDYRLVGRYSSSALGGKFWLLTGVPALVIFTVLVSSLAVSFRTLRLSRQPLVYAIALAVMIGLLSVALWIVVDVFEPDSVQRNVDVVDFLGSLIVIGFFLVIAWAVVAFIIGLFARDRNDGFRGRFWRLLLLLTPMVFLPPLLVLAGYPMYILIGLVIAVPLVYIVITHLDRKIIELNCAPQK